MPLGRKVFLAVVLSQLFSIALILGWYFYTLRSELGSLTQQRAQEAVLQSIAATEDYFKPAEAVVEAGQLLLSDHILGLDKPDPLHMPPFAPFLSPVVGIGTMLAALAFWRFGVRHYASTGT